MIRQWEDVSKEEEKITVRREDGGERKQAILLRHGRNGAMEEDRSRRNKQIVENSVKENGRRSAGKVQGEGQHERSMPRKR